LSWGLSSLITPTCSSHPALATAGTRRVRNSRA
jgi:hypothetical protein